MGSQYTHSSNVKANTWGALAGLGMLILISSVDWAAGRLGSQFCTTAGETARVLPSVAVSVWQALHVGVLGYQEFLDCALQLVVFLPQIFTGAI